MAPLFHKRHGFAADQELRLLKFNEEHFKAWIPKDASVPGLDEHIYLDWVLRDVIDEGNGLSNGEIECRGEARSQPSCRFTGDESSN
jgi:hypothetical protein